MSDSDQQLRLFEIYPSIQGESTLAGTPCTLVRLAGCPLRCSYCDTPEALPARSGTLCTVDAICQRVAALAQPLVLVTGGEPLAQPAVTPLLRRLLTIAPTLQLETSGSIDIRAVPAGVRRVIDIKTPGSGESDKNLAANLDALRPGDELKFVITNRDDYRWSVALIQRHNLTARAIPLLISPAHNQLDLQQLAAWMVADRLPIRLQPQLHKWIWGAEATGV